MASDGQSKNSIAKLGYVEVRSKHMKIFKKRWLVLYRSISSHSASLIKYKDEEHFKNRNVRAKYMVNNFVSIERLPKERRKYAVVVAIKEDVADIITVTFSCNSDTEANDWVDEIKKEMDGLSPSNDEFAVYLVPSVMTVARGEMVLRVRNGWLSLCDCSRRIVMEWSLTRVRHYKKEDSNTFWIEFGQTSEANEGTLKFTSTLTQLILERIHEEAHKICQKIDPAVMAPGKSNFLVQVPVNTSKLQMLRLPKDTNKHMIRQNFVSEPDLTHEHIEDQFDRERETYYTRNLSSLDLKVGKNSGYVDMNSANRETKCRTLPAPPPIADGSQRSVARPTRPPRRLDELQREENSPPDSENYSKKDSSDLSLDSNAQPGGQLDGQSDGQSDGQLDGQPGAKHAVGNLYHTLESVHHPSYENSGLWSPSTPVSTENVLARIIEQSIDESEIPDLPKAKKTESSGS